MPRKILLPNTIEGRLDRLTNRLEETNGVLLYQRYQDYCPIEYLLITGIGDAGHVKASPQSLDVLNEFFRLNRGYQFIKFHTHTRGTIDRYGEYYARHFSEWDIDSYRYQLKQNPEFIGLLATPKTILIWGVGGLEFSIVSDSPVRQQREKKIKEEMTAIARRKGYRIEPL